MKNKRILISRHFDFWLSSVEQMLIYSQILPAPTSHGQRQSRRWRAEMSGLLERQMAWQVAKCAFVMARDVIALVKWGFPEPAGDIINPCLTWSDFSKLMPTEGYYLRGGCPGSREAGERLCSFPKPMSSTSFLSASRRQIGLDQQLGSWLMERWDV